MELVPWRPFGGELSSLRNVIDRLISDFFGETPFARTSFTREWTPTIDISEKKDRFVIKAELPGMDVEDVNVSLSGDVLTIKDEKKKEKEEKDEHHYCRERYYGSFQRTFQLPAGVKGDKVDASFKKGVLKIVLPKAEEAKAQEIEIKTK